MDIITLSASDVDVLRRIAKNKDHKVRHALVADYREGFGWALTVIETVEQPEGFEPRSVDRRLRIAVNGRNEVYRRSDAKRYVASADAYGVSTPRALGNLVRPGDSLHIVFRLGNNNERMKAAGFEHDECDILVGRGPKASVIAVMRFADIVSDNGYTMADNSYQPERDGGAA